MHFVSFQGLSFIAKSDIIGSIGDVEGIGAQKIIENFAYKIRVKEKIGGGSLGLEYHKRK